MRQKLRILLDQDEPLFQFNARFLEWFNNDYGTDWKIDDIKDAWELERTLGPLAAPALRSYMRWPEFYTRLDPTPGAVEGVKQLLDWGHEVRIVTAVPVSAGIAYHGKCQSLRDHFPFFNLKHFFAVHQKNEVKGDILLDDGPHNIVPFKEDRRTAVVWDMPHNRHVRGNYRVYGWSDFLDFISRVSENIGTADCYKDAQ